MPESIFSKIQPPLMDVSGQPDQETSDDLKKLEADAQRQLLDLRDACAPFVFYVTIGWLVYVAVAVFLGSLWIPGSVLVALVAGTTAGIVGLLAAVIKYVFSDHHRAPKS
jgi:hypothetical protein